MITTSGHRINAIRALYSRGYRYFWLSAVISIGAVQMQQVARAFLARDLTSSPLLVTSVFALGTLLGINYVFDKLFAALPM